MAPTSMNFAAGSVGSVATPDQIPTPGSMPMTLPGSIPSNPVITGTDGSLFTPQTPGGPMTPMTPSTPAEGSGIVPQLQ